MTNQHALSKRPRLLAATVGLALAMAPIATAPARADSADDAFFSALSAQGVHFADRTVATTVAHGVCPSLKKGTHSLAWVVSGAVTSGISRQIATTLASQAVKSYCPDMIRSALGA